MKNLTGTSLVGILLTLLFHSSVLFADTPKNEFEIRIFSAIWCGPCKHLHALLEEAKAENQIEFPVFEKTVTATVTTIMDEDPRAELKVSAFFPEVQILKNGVLLGHQEGGSDTLETFQQKCSEMTENGILQTLVSDFTPSNSFAADKQLKNASIIFIGTGSGARNNPIFVGNAIKKSKVFFKEKFNLSNENVFTLYGASDPKEKKTEAFAILNHEDTFPYSFETIPNEPNAVLTEIPGVEADTSFDRFHLVSALQKISKSSIQNLLLLSSGYGEANGLNMWGKLGRLTPEMLTHDLALTGKNTVFISGNCHGGQFAKAARCGFFAARPDTLADGCSANSSELKYSNENRDYSSVLLHALDEGKKELVDTNHDGKISFSEAHFYAMASRKSADALYSTLDSYADDFFKDHRELLPDWIGSDVLDSLIDYASSEEKGALIAVLSRHRYENGLPIKKFILKDLEIPTSETFKFSFKKGGTMFVSKVEMNGKFRVSPFVPSGSLMNYTLSETSTASLKNVIGYLIQHEIASIRSLRLVLSASDDTRYDFFVTYQDQDGSFHEISLSNTKIAVKVPELFLEYRHATYSDDGVGYQRVVAQLIRRIYFKKMMVTGKVSKEMADKVADVISCESQSVNDFFSYFSTPKENF